MTTAITLPLWEWLLRCIFACLITVLICEYFKWKDRHKTEANLMDKFADAFEHGARMQISSNIAQLQKIVNNTDIPEETKKLIIDEFIKNIRK